jgi:hypothetical protein
MSGTLARLFARNHITVHRGASSRVWTESIATGQTPSYQPRVLDFFESFDIESRPMSDTDVAAGEQHGDNWLNGQRFRHLAQRPTPFEHAPSDEWLAQYPDEIARHVETLAIRSLLAAKRHLTIDITLPRQGRMRSAWLIPITRLGKEHATSFIDLRDEAGRAISLPTRTELGAITQGTLRKRLTSLGPTAWEQQSLEAALTTLVFAEPRHARQGLGAILEAFEKTKTPIPTRLRETLYQLVDNSIVWVRLVGRPGQRRIVKLAYDIPLEPPVVPARHPLIRRMRLVYDLDIRPPEGKINYRATLRRVRGRVTGRMGWDAIDLFIDDPVLQDPRSYHLEIAAPPGLEITEILLDKDDPRDPAQVSDGNCHLYVRFPRPRTSEQVRIKIRAERRGFLNASAGSSLVLAGLLWLFATHTGSVSRDAALAPEAAVLLIAPALMALFVSRPTESALIAAALTGVRSALGACAVASLAAAAALAGARLTHPVFPTLIGCAGIATAAATSIGIAWLGTFHIVRKHCNRFRAFWCGRPGTRRTGALALCTLACTIFGAWAILGFLDVFRLQHHPSTDSLLLGIVLLPAAAVWIPRRRGPVPAGVSITGILGLLAALAFLTAMIAHGWQSPAPSSTRLLALVVGATLALVSAVTALGAELAPVEPAAAWASERRPSVIPTT